jgi:hypothetical protein
MYKNDPRVIDAKFNCICSESGASIKKGEQCIYYPLSKSVFKMNTRQAKEYYEWKQDIELGYNY